MRWPSKGLFADQKIAIAPIKTASGASLEGDPLLSKDIRFFFEPNSAKLDKDAPQNLEYLDTIKRFLQVSPGSTVLLRGHVDNARVTEFREQGGEQLVKSMALKAMELSRQRALAVSDALRERHKDIDAAADRSRRPRLGRARRPRQRPEPPRRGAVVHAGVKRAHPRFVALVGQKTGTDDRRRDCDDDRVPQAVIDIAGQGHQRKRPQSAGSRRTSRCRCDKATTSTCSGCAPGTARRATRQSVRTPSSRR